MGSSARPACATATVLGEPAAVGTGSGPFEGGQCRYAVSYQLLASPW